MSEQNPESPQTVSSDQPPKREWHRRHHDWEAFDRIELAVEPRYKTSGLSGDEWRTGVRAKFFFKGEIIYETSFRDMKTAASLLSHSLLAGMDVGIPNRILDLEKTKCDQVGCHRDAVNKVRLKRLTSARGEYLHDDEGAYSTSIRHFCKRHLRRGDCGREDADDNYEVLDGPGPDDTSNLEESPSAFGGVVEIDGID